MLTLLTQARSFVGVLYPSPFCAPTASSAPFFHTARDSTHEKVTQVTAARRADDLRSRHAKGGVGVLSDRSRDRVKERRPSTAALELLTERDQLLDSLHANSQDAPWCPPSTGGFHNPRTRRLPCRRSVHRAHQSQPPRYPSCVGSAYGVSSSIPGDRSPIVRTRNCSGDSCACHSASLFPCTRVSGALGAREEGAHLGVIGGGHLAGGGR